MTTDFAGDDDQAFAAVLQPDGKIVAAGGPTPVVAQLPRSACRRQRVPAQRRPAEQLADAVRAVAAGDTLLAPTITRRLVELYLRRPPPGDRTPPGLATLTDRELDVLRRVARGRSNQQIASTLFLGESTVKTHLTHLFAKLGLRDRAQSVVLAYESGLIQPGDD